MGIEWMLGREETENWNNPKKTVEIRKIWKEGEENTHTELCCKRRWREEHIETETSPSQWLCLRRLNFFDSTPTCIHLL